MGFYIIEINDKYKQVVLLSADGELYCKDVAGLMPYTEPDIYAIRKEAYAEGYEDGMQLSIDDAKLKEEYKRGLSDMRDALKLIEKAECVDDLVSLGFDVETAGGWSIAIKLLFEKYSPSEIIEKIRQYEQEKDKQAGIEYNCEEIKDVLNTTMKVCNVSLDDIAEVLQKMKETE